MGLLRPVCCRPDRARSNNGLELCPGSKTHRFNVKLTELYGAYVPGAASNISGGRWAGWPSVRNTRRCTETSQIFNKSRFTAFINYNLKLMFSFYYSQRKTDCIVASFSQFYFEKGTKSLKLSIAI